MSIELWIVNDCDIYCEWGLIEHTEPRPELNQVGHLMLTGRDYVANLIESGPKPAPRGNGIHSATTDGNRIFAHIDWLGGKRWTWELFETHWWDGGGPDMYIGRWPD